MKVFVPGMLVRTNYSQLNHNMYNSTMWKRYVPPDGFRVQYRRYGSACEGHSEPYLYIGILPEDERFAEILIGDEKIAVSLKILEIYE